jgi:hypothetical protein
MPETYKENQRLEHFDGAGRMFSAVVVAHEGLARRRRP